jgi:capsular polysaccharide biosynthesis protein
VSFRPAQAARLADAVAEAFQPKIVGFKKVQSVKVVDSALVPTLPVRPRPAMNTAIAGVMGLRAAAGLTFLLPEW